MAQISKAGMPISFKLDPDLRNKIPVYEMLAFDIEKTKAEIKKKDNVTIVIDQGFNST